MGTWTVNEILCLSLAVGLARDRLDAPGFLRGRQRSREFRDALLVLAAYLLQVHGATAKHAHVFPLSRMALQPLVKLEEHTIRRCIPVLESIGLITRLTTLTRRWEAKTDSQSEGATSDWYCPHQFAMGEDFEKLFPPKVGADLAALPFGSHCDQNKLTNPSEEYSGNTTEKGSEIIGPEGSGRNELSIDDDDLIDGAYDGPQRPQNGRQPVRATRVAASRSRASRSLVEDEAPDPEIMAMMRAKYGDQPVKLSDEGRASYQRSLRDRLW